MQNSALKRVFITGGAGFIGSHLAESLRNSGAEVVVLDNFDPFYDPRLKAQNTAGFESTGIELVRGDIRDFDSLSAILRDFQPEAIVHLAAKAGVRPSLEDPAEYVDVNLHGTSLLLEAARESGVRKLVFASSSSVYGASKSEFFRESDRTDRPLSPYGATKKAGELLCHTYHHLYGFSVACLRFFTVYGPRQRPDLAIRKFVQLALDGKELPIFGDGSSSRDYTHIDDTLRGIRGALSWVNSGIPRYGIFNLGSARPIELRKMISIIESALEREIPCTHLSEQPGDVPRTLADTSKAARELGYEQRVSFEAGLRDFILWLKSHQL